MKLARNLERRLERIVDGLAVKLFRGDLHPVELAGRLVREADLAVFEGPAGTTAPNHFIVRIPRGDYGDDAVPAEVGIELSSAVADTALERGWRLEGPVTVNIVVDGRLSAGSLRCEPSVRPGLLPEWGRLDTHGLRHNREVVGRSGTADIALPDRNVSRRHALIWREVDGTWIADLGSANGTVVNGRPITAPVALGAGDSILLGTTQLTYLPG